MFCNPTDNFDVVIDG